MNNKSPIGVIDSGVGGLSVLKRLQQALPNEDFIYLGDTKRTPYGTREEQEVRKFVGEMLDFMDTQQIKLLVIACNTLTVLGTDTLKGSHAFDLIGMSKGANLVLNASKNKKIGVMATQFTISTQAHAKAITALDGDAQIFPQACPEFVPLIESEAFDSAELQNAVKKYTAPLKATGIDTVILSCTHYPFIKNKIAAAFAGSVNVIDPADETAANTAAFLKEHGLLNDKAAGRLTICCTADIERMKRLAARMLDTQNCVFKQINLL